MKKLLILLFFLPFALCASSRQDTIAVSKTKKTFIVFEAPIESMYFGTDSLQLFSEKRGNIAKLQEIVTGNPFIPTNLFVILNNGETFYFEVISRKQNSYHYEISSEQKNKYNWANGRKRGAVVLVDSVKQDEVNTVEDVEDLEPILLGFEKFAKMKSNVGGGMEHEVSNVSLYLSHIAYFQGYIYMKFWIKNKSSIDFTASNKNYPKFATRNKKGADKESDEEAPKRPVYALPSLSQSLQVKSTKKQEFTVVFKKFTLNPKEEFFIEVKELSGERDLLVPIPHFIINNATNLE